ncbi:MAG: A/G-specific adenine glycosylase [Pseudomonadota bacterium]
MRDQVPPSPVPAELLAWYDAHARSLPWRIPPGERARPDPYRIWLSEIMLQQTTVAAVKSYYQRFTSLWPTVGDLAAAADDRVMGEWAGLGYYARARNLLKCARAVVDEYNGVFPDTREDLLTLPGIGPYTAAAVAAIAFGRAETVVDGNVERVMARVFAVDTPLPAAKPELTELAKRLTPSDRPGDYAQAVMDLGATICTPKSPACGICPWRDPCAARAAGIAADLPKKTRKKPKPTRRGVAYIARNSAGHWLLERRPDKGLLGGMLGWPGTDWSHTPAPAPPLSADWQIIGEVRHTFTHFHLILDIAVARSDATPNRGAFHNDVPASDLPRVMAKAYNLAATYPL